MILYDIYKPVTIKNDSFKTVANVPIWQYLSSSIGTALVALSYANQTGLLNVTHGPVPGP